MDRRNFLLTTGAMGGMLTQGNVSFAQDTNEKDKNAVIYVFLGGGATHIETFNPIPLAPSNYRSVTGTARTNVAGMELGGLFKELAKKGDKIALARAFHHRDANHASATHWVVTGEPNFGAGTTQKWPSYGSVVSGAHGTNAPNGLPTYIKMNGIQHDDAAWMGGRYTGYDATREGRKDLQLGVPDKRFAARIAMLNKVESSFQDKSMLAKSWKELRGQAVEVILGEASKAFKVEQDTEYEDYKETSFGKDLLTAVRLIETGSKFITINYGGWDMHNNISAGLNNRQVELDAYLAKLIDTLEKRGLYERVMLVVTSEFGRTPKVNANGGRDHWARLAPLMISCGSYDMGRVVGTSDKNAEAPEDGLCEPEDLKWTIFDHLGIDKKMSWSSIEGRPMYIVKEEAKNILTDIV